jgi:hypothetical protein
MDKQANADLGLAILSCIQSDDRSICVWQLIGRSQTINRHGEAYALRKSRQTVCITTFLRVTQNPRF